MSVQKLINKKRRRNKIFFVGIFKVTDEKSRIQSRIRIRWSEVRIQGSGSIPKCPWTEHCRGQYNLASKNLKKKKGKRSAEMLTWVTPRTQLMSSKSSRLSAPKSLHSSPASLQIKTIRTNSYLDNLLLSSYNPISSICKCFIYH
jgi:hypothetical protein